jgi:hypothetical protein
MKAPDKHSEIPFSARGNASETYLTAMSTTPATIDPAPRLGRELAARRKQLEHRCQTCHQPFTGLSHKRYCSPACRTAARKQQRRPGRTLLNLERAGRLLVFRDRNDQSRLFIEVKIGGTNDRS